MEERLLDGVSKKWKKSKNYAAYQGQLGAFYFVFYLTIGAFFAAHLAIFVAMTPSPASGILPWNFGRYAYPNYPNSKIGILIHAHVFGSIIYRSNFNPWDH